MPLATGGRYRVRAVVDNAQSPGKDMGQQVALHNWAQTTAGVKYQGVTNDDVPVPAGLSSDVIGCDDVDPTFRVLSASRRKNPGWTSTEFGNPNNHSVILRVDFGDASFLFPGDLESTASDDLAARFRGSDGLAALLDR